MPVETIVVGQGTQYPLNGLLTLPDAPRTKMPAVVFVHGSGPSNMDERVGKLTPFRDLAEGLGRRGIASLRYDKRTYAHARALRRQSLTVREETVEDALLAAALLRADARIDADAIFLVGHSMGAMLAPRIDAEGGGFRGLVLMAGSPLRLEDIMLRQFRQAAQSKNALLRAVAKLEETHFGKKLIGLDVLPDEEAKRKKFAGSVNLWYFKEMGRKGAADYLLESDKPVLILQGGMDFQVLPEEDFARFRVLLQGRDKVEYRLYEGLNHLFVPGISNDILNARAEYAAERHIGPEVIDDIADFIHRNLP